MVKTAAPRVTLRAVIVCILFFPALFSSCSLFGNDQFPGYLKYAVAKVDLGALYQAEGLKEPVSVSRAFLTADSGTGSRAFIFASSYEGSRLFVFDGATIKHVKTVQNNGLRSFLTVLPSGNYLCGGVELDAATLSIVSDTRPTISLSDSARSFTDGVYLYVLYQDGAGLHCDRYDGAWNHLSSASVPPLSGFSTSSYQLLDAYHEASVSSKVRLLFSTYSGVRSVTFASVADFLAAYGQVSLDLGSESVVALPYFSDNGGWATRDGLIALSYEQNSRVIRYSYDTGSELDDERLDSTNGDRRYYFDPSGYFRLFLDEDTELLHLLRTWWK
ncbi:MAG: hypothetical protein WCT14_09125 [Treponemataceae bacterium]